jgi:tRNA(His) guanylyltransferase
MADDALGDRMKDYEGHTADRRLIPRLPVCIRLDGRSFSSFTKGMERPFDPKMSKLMVDVTQRLVEETNAVIGYTQSDEISLVLYAEDAKSQTFFDGRIQKLESVLASMATAVFNRLLPASFPDRVDRLPLFDCRVWNVPTKEEAANAILWRERDATKNSVSMAARAYYSHNELMGKNGSQMQEMLFQKGINWNDYPAFFKRGTFIQRRKVSKPFTAEELSSLPPKHQAHQNPDLVIERTQTVKLEMPPFGRVTNRTAVIFGGEDPVVGEADTTEAGRNPWRYLTAEHKAMLADVVEPTDRNERMHMTVTAVKRILGDVVDTETERLRRLLAAACHAYQYAGRDESWLDEANEVLGFDTSKPE